MNAVKAMLRWRSGVSAAGPAASFLAASFLAASFLAMPAAARADAEADDPARRLPGAGGTVLQPVGSYAVVASEATYARPDWRRVVEALRVKYKAEVLLFPAGHPEAALPGLQACFPNYACFVAPPEECGRAFVVAVHRLTRRLDDDPYGDLLWGILTGYEAADALRLAALDRPLVIRRGATSMGPGLLDTLESGFASDEANPSNFWTKASGATGALHRAVAPDAARALAEAFAEMPVDYFKTSGHATERDWQIAYNLPGGAFRHERGQLFALGSDGARHPFRSANPKVYLPVGNCLIGHIDRRDCMATAWLHSGGAAQMIGYTVVTFYGYMGWGTGMLFDDGRLTLSEAFFLNNQALLHELETRYPQVAKAQPDAYGNAAPGTFRSRYDAKDHDALGLLWDRDTVAFYGDPAWAARFPPERAAVGVEVRERDGRWTVTAEVQKNGALKDAKWGGRPLAVLLPERVAEIRNVTSEPPCRALVTDRFVLIPVAGERTAGQRLTVTFEARRAR
jgi:zinc protease